MRTALGMVALSIFAACGEDAGKACTDNLVMVQVEVIAPADLVIDRVTVENSQEVECTRDDGETEPRTGSGGYDCPEQAGGAYDFVVESGEERFTQSAVFEHDGCHIVDPEEIVFDITGQ
jgi:hypothetical protein